MSVGLHNLRRSMGSIHRSKRVGRGLGSGHGTSSTRGTKGQRARSGGRAGINRRALRVIILQLPKFKGMQRTIPKPFTVSVEQLEQSFTAGGTVDGKALIAAGLIPTASYGVKILGGKKISKALTVTADGFSAGAIKAIEAAGGKAIVVKHKR